MPIHNRGYTRLSGSSFLSISIKISGIKKLARINVPNVWVDHPNWNAQKEKMNPVKSSIDG